MSDGISGAARALFVLVALALLCTAPPASAGLGGDLDSVTADSVRFRSQLVSTPMRDYQRHDIALGSNGVIHEYLSNAGKVFAVTWQGPLPPDLRQLFGDYFEPFRAAAAAQVRPGAHRYLRVSEPDFVVESSGHLRSFQGRAYVLSLVPPGVDVGDLP
jgi:uncharacterized protein DUF2844